MDTNVNTSGDVHGGEAVYDAHVPYTENVPLVFPDFTLTFLGIHDIVLDNGATLSLQTYDYRIEDNDKEQQVLKIGNGQLPNPPRDFSVGNKIFTLWTGVGPDGKLLDRGTLIVERK